MERLLDVRTLIILLFNVLIHKLGASLGPSDDPGGEVKTRGDGPEDRR